MQCVDTNRYPIDQLDSEHGQTFVVGAAAQFATTGVLVLPGFLTDWAVGKIAAEATALLDHRFHCRSEHNVFLDDGLDQSGDAEPSVDSAWSRSLLTSVASIANDYLAADGVLQQLYDWPALTEFIGAVLGYEQFYRGADPLGALSINVYGAGDRHEWHFDESRFSVTLMVQEAEDGGHFEYVPGLRTDEGVDADKIRHVLDGDESQVERLQFSAGSLSIFGGRNMLHRVTEVGGDGHRLVPVLTYDTVAGSTNSDQVRELFWGRTGR